MRFRLEQWIPYLEAEGFQFTFVPFEDDRLHEVLYTSGRRLAKVLGISRALARRLGLMPSVGKYDLVYVYREAALLGPPLIERLIALRGVPIVYDFDDPIWLPYRSPTNPRFGWLKFPGKTASICRLATAVTVGNRLLAGWAQQHSEHVHVVPSTIELSQYPLKQQAEPPPMLTLGWTGSHSTLPFLDMLKGVLERLYRVQPFRLLVISHTDRLEGATPYPVIARKWKAETEATDLHEIDIGLAPFPDSGWTPWRCHGKVLQYMAAGIPTVASRLGILPDYIQDGEEGFLVSDEDAWLERLLLLMKDPALRQQMGRRGRGKIEADYSAALWAPRVGDILRNAARKTK